MLRGIIAEIVAGTATVRVTGVTERAARYFAGSAVLAQWEAKAKRISSWLRYEVIYLWPSRQNVATFNVGLMPVDAAIFSEPGMSAVPSTIQVYSELARAIRSSCDVGPDLKALEIGSGRGGGLAYLKRILPFGIKGLDRSAAAVRFARRRGIDAVCGSVTRLPFPSASLDIALSVEMLFIFGETDQALAELARVLKPGGCIIAADFRKASIGEAEGHVRGLAERNGFAMLSFEDLTERARCSIIEGEPARRKLLETVPRMFHRDLPDMLSLEGTPRYQGWVSGRRSYFLTVLERR